MKENSMNEKEKNAIEEFRKQLRLAINIDDVTTAIRNDNAKTILNLIEKLQKENEELNKHAIHLTDEQYRTVIDLAQNDINKQWIQKVRDKIEELQNGPLKINENNKYYYETEAYNKIIIQVLQELLEGRK